MLRGLVGACALVILIGSAANGAPRPAPEPSPTATSNPEAERLFLAAKDAWRERTDVPFVRYGALIRYLHNGHVFDNWWDAYARTSDGQLSLTRLVDIDEDRRRLRGIPFSIFGFEIFDTNRDAEPIRLDQPNISPTSSFGVLLRSYGAPRLSSPDPLATPDPYAGGDDFRTIGRVEANARDYRIEFAGTDTLRDGPAVHLTLEPLRTPQVNRLRDLWLDPQTHRTMQLNVAGIYNGQPYDQIEWTVHYVQLEGRNYVQQVVADAPLHFGLDTMIPKFEIDLVDYHFPTEVPKYTFDKPFGY
jgi:hypothetical protein